MDTRVAEFWRNLQDNLETLLWSVVPKWSNIVYIDYPVHRNVGDLLIFFGTEVWIKKSNFKVNGRWSIDNFRFPEISKDVVILCHGGGNFGDIYRHQFFRENIVKKYKDNRIVFLPQTIFYKNRCSIEASGKILNRHSDIHLLLRDQRSLEFAKLWFPDCNSNLAPDMATFLYPLQEKLNFHQEFSPTGERLYLFRKDLEQRIDHSYEKKQEGWVGDWEEMLGFYSWKLRFLQGVGRYFHPIVPPRLFSTLWHFYARRSIVRCALEFGKAGHISTSRLHGHILASLLGIPNTLYDNSYGKNFAYFHCWHQDLHLAKLHGHFH